MRFSSLAALALAVTTASGAALVPAASAQTAAPAPYSSSTTTIGVLAADPAAKAILAKYLPKLVEGGQYLDQASGMTLKELQDAIKAYAPDMLTDKILADIDKELAALPPK